MKKFVPVISTIIAASMLASCTPDAPEKDSKSKSKPSIPDGYESKCGDCRGELEDGYNYCMYCGTKVGEGAFEPYENENECVYGAPMSYLLQCDDCDFTHEENTMGDKPRYCPICGQKADVQSEDRLK